MAQVVEARRESVSSQIRRKLGRHPAIPMQAVILESTVDIPLAGQHVKAGQRTRVVVQADEVDGLMSMVERDPEAVTRAKERCENDILRKLRDESVVLGTPEEQMRRDYYPDSWQAAFQKIYDRPAGCLVYAELDGEPFAGHPDGLDKDGAEVDAMRHQELASVVAAAVTAAMSSPAMRAMMRSEAVAAMDAATSPREESKPRK